MAKQNKTVTVAVDASTKRAFVRAGNSLAEVANALHMASDERAGARSSKK